MEGRSRPTFFRGVATVVTKLFNAVEVRALMQEKH
jgi:pantoate--beta-alanine ligase